jgi:atlastin
MSAMKYSVLISIFLLISSEFYKVDCEQANIIQFSEEKGIIIDSEELAKIFLHPDVADRNVIVISIVGAFRTGKSFILSYFLKYLYANVS